MPFKLHYYKSNPFTENETSRNLFHYTTLESLKLIQTNRSIRFRKNNFSNDDKDGMIINLINQAIERNENNLYDCVSWKAYKNLCTVLMDFIQINTLNKSKDFTKMKFPNMFNFCLSSTIRSEKMWEQYAKNQICIEFSESFLRRALDYHPSKGNKGKYLHFSSADIIYSLPIQMHILDEIIKNSYEDYKIKYDPQNHASYQSVFHDVTLDFLFCSYIFKEQEKWSYENECRFFLMYFPELNHGVQYQSANPFIELSFYHDIWNAMIKKVWILDETIRKEVENMGLKCEKIESIIF